VRIDVVTLFPEFFRTPLTTGLLEDALQNQIATVGFIDPRTFTHDKHRTVDDTPYGGGGGMLMKVEPLAAAIEAAGGGRVLITSPQGKPLEQRDFERWARESHLVIVCGRYEGIDDRIAAIAHEEISIGDFVLTGGEYAALAILDGVIRLLPGTLGNVASHANDSFSRGLLEGPQYTRPPEWRGMNVPETLASGHHAAIEQFRRREAIVRTRARRPDLLRELALDKKDRAALAASPSALPPISIALSGEDPATIVEVSRLARAYGIEDLTTTRDLTTLKDPPSIIAGALPFALKSGPPVVGPRALVSRAREEKRRIVLALGAGYFEGKQLAEGIEVLLPSIRPAAPEGLGATPNDLSLLETLSILLDRLAGEG
jgi:tRNA (guanine37-N1)-methyltransferase